MKFYNYTSKNTQHFAMAIYPYLTNEEEEWQL